MRQGVCQSCSLQGGGERGLLATSVICTHHGYSLTFIAPKEKSTLPASPTLLQDQRKGALELRISMHNTKRGSTQWEASPTERNSGARLAPERPGRQQAHPERVETPVPRGVLGEQGTVSSVRSAKCKYQGRPDSQETASASQATTTGREDSAHSSFLSVGPSIVA